jgi:hypothetical protein
MCVASCLCFTGICTALVGVFGRATVFVIVALGGLRLGGDESLDSFRLGMLLLEGRLVRAAFEEDLVEEELVLFLDVRSSLCLGEDFVVEIGVGDEGGGSCRRAYKNALGVIIMMTSTGVGDPSLRGSDRGISDSFSKRQGFSGACRK